MRLLLAIACALPLAAAGVQIAAAAPNTGSTALQAAPVTGTDVPVLLTIFGSQPVVPYGYSLENDCLLPTGHMLSTEVDPIVSWTGQDGSGDPQTTMSIHLASIPSGSSCKVFITKNNVAVKGSSTSYTVQP